MRELIVSKRLLLPLLALWLVAGGAWAQQTFSLEYEGIGMDTVLVRVMVDEVDPQPSFAGASVWLAYDTSMIEVDTADGIIYAGGLFGVWDFNWFYDKVDEGIGNANYSGTSQHGTFISGPGTGMYIKCGIKSPYDINSCDYWFTVCSTRVGDYDKVHAYYPETPDMMTPAHNSDVYTTMPTFGWSGTCGPHGTYTLEYSTTSDFSANVVEVGGISENTWTSAIDLTPGTYYWRVQAFDVLSRGSGFQSQPFSFDVLACPDIPANLNGSADEVCAGTEFCVTWDHAQYAEWYEISDDGGATWRGLGYVQSFCTDTLAAGSYEYLVRACNTDCGCSAAGPAVAVTVKSPLPKPAQPTAAPAVVCVGNLYCISWTIDPNAASYQIQENEGPWTPIGLTNQQCMTKDVGGEYYYRIRACDAVCGCSEPSDSVVVSVGGAPLPPDTLYVDDDTVCTGAQFTLSWPAVSGATGYGYRVNGSGWTSVGNVLSVGLSQAGTGSYVYEVQTCNNECGGTSCSGPSPSVTVVVMAAPAKVAPVCNYNAVTAELEFEWAKVTSATAYKVYRNGAVVYNGPDTAFLEVVPEGIYSYRVATVNACGEGPLSDEDCIIDNTDVWEIPGAGLPTTYSLGQNYPNPFNPETYIEFALPRSAHAVLEVYNVLGRRVNVLVDEYLSAGEKVAIWDGTDQSGALVSSGIYFYRLQADDFVATKKMILMK